MAKERFKVGLRDQRRVTMDWVYIQNFFFNHKGSNRTFSFFYHLCWYGRFDKQGRLNTEDVEFNTKVANGFGIRIKSFKNELSLLNKYGFLIKIRKGIYEINSKIIIFHEHQPK